MATIAIGADGRPLSGDNRFFLISAVLMTAIMFAGFSMQLAMGRSSFAAPLVVHLHALVFMGWVVIYLAQTALATLGPIALHRRLGWIAAVWLVPMLVMGPAITIDRVRSGRVPFFFEPQHFLIANPLTLLAFVALTVAAIVLRRRTDWHRRLHHCAMAAILGPGLGRLLPMPLMEPVAFQVTVIVGLFFPIAGIIHDVRRGRGVHRAWMWGLGTILAAMLVSEGIVRSPAGDVLYRTVTAGYPGANVAPMAFALPPGS